MAIYKRGRGFEIKVAKWPELDLNPEPLDYKSDVQTTWTRCQYAYVNHFFPV